jgi:pantothenate kinase-related protein Tda10
MAEFRDDVQLAAKIRERLVGDSRFLIGVDGAYGSGKSTLARKLAEQLGAAYFEVDKYALGDGRPYRQQLRYDDMRRDLEGIRGRGPVIVDGACLLDILDCINAPADVSIYVKRMDSMGIWQDEDTCNPEIIDLDSPWLKGPGAALTREIAAYHLSRDPLASANDVFIREVP